MSINSISAMSGSYSTGQSSQSQLSEETKRKLQALGIDPSTVTSETQAQALIAAAQQQVQQTTNESSSQNTCCSSECELISRAKILAEKIGVQTSTNDSLENLIDKISSKITSLTSLNNDSKAQSETNQYQNELTSIQNEYSTVSSNQNSIMTAMNLTANMNKLLLGIQ